MQRGGQLESIQVAGLTDSDGKTDRHLDRQSMYEQHVSRGGVCFKLGAATAVDATVQLFTSAKFLSQSGKWVKSKG